MDFKGKNIVITGSGAGIGKRTAEKFLEQGARVMLSDINEKALLETAEEFSPKGEVISAVADMGDAAAVQNMANKAIETFGSVDVWINNAGAGSGYKLFTESGQKDWEFDIRTNFYSVLNGCNAILPHFTEKKAGKIVNTVSDSGRIGEARLATYAAAKAAVICFTKSLAKEVGRFNIMVNCVSLGTTKTKNIVQLMAAMGEKKVKMMESQYALKRLGEIDDAANALMLMSSDYASWITGQTLSSSGGFSFAS